MRKFSDEELCLRKYFPLIHNQTLAYLDNAATSQKPQSVIDEITRFYQEDNANPMRGLYGLSIRATNLYENARQKIANFIHVNANEIIFTRNASESLNLIACTYGRKNIQKGDEILISIVEHHSNFLPWQQLAKDTGAILRYLDCSKDGDITLSMLENSLTDKTKLVAITHISNVLGREYPISDFAKAVHQKNAVLVLDASQSIPHIKVDASFLNVDFMVFSGHKVYAPMGIGVLYGKKALLDAMPPFLYGGEMIEMVTKESTTFATVPYKFEAGTVNASGAIALATAIDFIEEIGFDTIIRRENMLTKLAFDELADYPYIHILGAKEPEHHHGILSFTIEGVHPHDIAEILASDDIAIRAGHHCAQPLHRHLGIFSSARASFAFYNTEEEVLRFTSSIKNLRKRMGYNDEHIL